MNSIRIDTTVYDKALLDFGQEGDHALCRGNILLMAGRVAEARELFERIYESTPDSAIAEATDNIARCIKAEDGHIARARRFVLSVRPPTTGPAATP